MLVKKGSLKHAILGYLPAEQQQWMIMPGHSQQQEQQDQVGHI